MSLLIYFAADASVHADQAHATDDGEVFTERDAFWRERGHTLPPDSSEYILIVFVEEGVAVSGGWWKPNLESGINSCVGWGVCCQQ